MLPPDVLRKARAIRSAQLSQPARAEQAEPVHAWKQSRAKPLPEQTPPDSPAPSQSSEVLDVSDSEVLEVSDPEQPEPSHSLRDIDDDEDYEDVSMQDIDDDDDFGQNPGPSAVDDVDDSEVLRQARSCCAQLEMQQALGISASDFAAAGWGRC